MFLGDIQISGDHAATESNLDCVVYYMTTRLWYCASVILLTFISTERFLAICAPLRHRLMIGKKRTLKLLILAWSLASLCTVAGAPGKLRLQTSCLIWPPGEKYQNLPTVYRYCESINDIAEVIVEALILLSFMVLFTINVILYARIIIALSSRRISTPNKSINNVSKPELVRNQVARTLVINGIVFFICQLPYRIISLDRMVEAICGVPVLERHTHFTLKAVGHAFLFLNSNINPFLYVGSCRHYRQAMRDAFLVLVPCYSQHWRATMICYHRTNTLISNVITLIIIIEEYVHSFEVDSPI